MTRKGNMQDWRENVKVNHYDLINYFDVWGNEQDGWEVNNQCVEIEDISITEDSTDKEIAQYLVQIGFLITDDLRRLAFDSSTSLGIEIFEKKGMRPLGLLRERIV